MVLKIKKNKKAFFFTIGAIFLLTFFLLSFKVFSIHQQVSSVKDRVETLNNFVFSMEKDLPRQVYASGFRIIFLIEKNIVDTGDYIDSVNDSFNEAFFNGSLNGKHQKLMEGVTFSDIINNINLNAEKVNMNLNVSNYSIEVKQDGPWRVNFTLHADFNLSDKGGLVSWNKKESVSTLIKITNFEDPLYVISTGGLVTNKINQTPYENFTEGSDVSNLEDHVKNKYYKESSLAPSFLDRLEGKLTANLQGNGIESLVYLPELFQAGLPIKEKSCVDYIYFSENNPTSHQIQGMPSWFRLDNAHLDMYNASGLVI